MPDRRDDIQQIEYRWQHEQDLSPFASTMSQPITAGWDDWIRAWVRHPHAPGLAESVCYRVWHGTGEAALAWRYRDSRAAEHADGTSDRPHVSRVLVGHASLLAPELAIAICLNGRLPASVRPHRVSSPGELPTIDPDELTIWVNEQAAGLDHQAAQQPGLLELVAVALSDRDRPLAVYLPAQLIMSRLRASPQGPLLWALHRIMRAVPGDGRRGWSFSTFELPLGAQDAATLPDIVFRQAIPASPPPGIVRDEVKAWPLEPDTLIDLRKQHVSRARCLVEAYAKQGLGGVKELIAEEARGEQYGRQTVLLPQSHERYDGISDDSDNESPVVTISQPPFGFVPVTSPGQAEGTPEPSAAETPQPPPIHPPPRPRPTAAGTTSFAMPPTVSGQEPEEMAADEDSGQPELERPAGRHRRTEEDSLAAGREGQSAPPLALQADKLQADNRQTRRLGYLLKQMSEARDASALREILRFVESRAEVGRTDSHEAVVERQEARRAMSPKDWYDSVAQSSGHRLKGVELATIFQLIVIPDLGRAEDVDDRIGVWADGAAPEMVSGLLIAARNARLREKTGHLLRRPRKDPLEYVRQKMQPRLASRWAGENGLADWWDTE